MPHSAERALLRPLAFAAALLASDLALAEVSDKVTSVSEIWSVGVGAAMVCFLGAYLRPWSLLLLVPYPAYWFAGLLVESHFSDIAAALYQEQGAIYYAQAYASLALWLIGLAVGWVVGKKAKTHQRERSHWVDPSNPD